VSMSSGRMDVEGLIPRQAPRDSSRRHQFFRLPRRRGVFIKIAVTVAYAGLAVCGRHLHSRDSPCGGLSVQLSPGFSLTPSLHLSLDPLDRGYVGRSVAVGRRAEPDVAMQGKLRALGRLLRIVGSKLNVAATSADRSRLAGAGSCFRGSCFSNGSVLATCGTSMQSAADALLREDWMDANLKFASMSSHCSVVFPQQHLAVFQGYLGGSSMAPDLLQALTSLSKGLEVQAERITDASDQLQDAIFEAAGALRSAARLFMSPRAETRGSRRTASTFTNDDSSESSDTASFNFQDASATNKEIERKVAALPLEEQKVLLRRLARQYHPDRHPGQEMEVLPIFLHVQRLREESRKWL